MDLNKRTEHFPDNLGHRENERFLEIVVLPSKGRAVVAKKLFSKGETVLQFMGQKKHVSELSDLTHALQIDQQTFLAPSGKIDDYVNHSCNPNTGIRNDSLGGVFLFALRNIEVGDEITFDYATTQSGGFAPMKCFCGEPNCRGIINDFKDLPRDRQEIYRNLGALLDYLF
jgi:SET domain-containing protein